MADPKNDSRTEQRTKIEAKTVVEASASDGGLLVQFVAQSAQLAEGAAQVAFGAIRDFKGEVYRTFTSTIDLVQGVQQGAYRLVRTVGDRVDHLADDAIGVGENVAVGLLRATREASVGVTQLAGRATAALVAARTEGERPVARAQA